jgi:hypothetical protein
MNSVMIFCETLSSHLLNPLALVHIQASESKKEAFRKYLESSGVLDSLTKGES